MDDIFSCGETAWDLIHDRSFFLLRKKYTSSFKGNPVSTCYLLFFIIGISSVTSWFALVSSLLFYKFVPNIHFLYYFSAYTAGFLPVLALHKNYEHNMSKRDFPKAAFLLRMAALSIYGTVICVILDLYNFSLLFSVFCIIGLGLTHGALLGGLSQFASVFPSPCYGYLILGVDFAGLIPLLIVVLLTVFPDSMLLQHVLYIVPAGVSMVGLVSLIVLIQSEMGSQYLEQSHTVLRNNSEGLESLLCRSNDEDSSSVNNSQYVSLSSFVDVHHSSTHNKDAIAWGALVFVCTFCTYFMIPYFPEARKTSSHFPVYLFFVQHFSDTFGRELLCGFVKKAVKGKAFMSLLVILRALIIIGWLAEVLTCPVSGLAIGAMEIGALVLCGLVGGSINPAIYMLAGLGISDDSRDSVQAMRVCMWGSVTGAVTALGFLNIVSFVLPNLYWSI